jgi:hypothetical protein
MKLSEVLDALMEGKPITRAAWEQKYMYYDKDDNCFVYVYHDNYFVPVYHLDEPDEIGSKYELASVGLDLVPGDVIADDWDIDYWDTDHIVEDNNKVDEE